jgi:hypothetical protein
MTLPGTGHQLGDYALSRPAISAGVGDGAVQISDDEAVASLTRFV